MTWVGFGVDFVVRGTLVLAAGFAASYGLGRASAALRHLTWTAAFVALLAMPVALRLGPRIAVAAWPAAASGQAGAATLATASQATAPSTDARQGDVRTGSLAVSGGYVLALYLAGLLLVAGRFLGGAVRTSRMVRQAGLAPHAQGLADGERSALGIGRAVRVLESAGAPVPMAWGVRRPVVLLPEPARGWPAARLHAVVLHELVHVARHDLVAQLAAQAACCLYWFHPLVWLAARELRKERERACDDAVLTGGVAAPDYAGHLLELARALVERRSLADAPAMAEAGDLEGRVRAVLDGSRNRAPLSRQVAVTVGVLACALMLPVALVSVQAQAGTGALAGTVQDLSKARIPGCDIRIKNLDGKNEEITKTNAAGDFGFAAIPVGRYAIEARSRGFAVGKAEVLVEAGRRAEALVTLELGQTTESITVRGSKPPTAVVAPTEGQVSTPPHTTPIRIPIGGNVQAAKLIKMVHPIYPADLKQQGITGTVIVRAVISTTGEPLHPEVINTTVNPGLAQAALDAVRQWRYQPTLLNGQPVEFVTTITLAFELD